MGDINRALFILSWRVAFNEQLCDVKLLELTSAVRFRQC